MILLSFCDSIEEFYRNIEQKRVGRRSGLRNFNVANMHTMHIILALKRKITESKTELPLDIISRSKYRTHALMQPSPVCLFQILNGTICQ